MGPCKQEYSSMYASLCAWVLFCTQIGVACIHDSIDNLISLIGPNSMEIWACTCRAWLTYKLSCVLRSHDVLTQVQHILQFLLNISDLTQFGQNMGLCMQAHSVHKYQLRCQVILGSRQVWHDLLIP